jgi:hypothetical protein
VPAGEGVSRPVLEVPLEGLSLGLVSEVQGDHQPPVPVRRCVRRSAGVVLLQPTLEVGGGPHVASGRMGEAVEKVDASPKEIASSDAGLSPAWREVPRGGSCRQVTGESGGRTECGGRPPCFAFSLRSGYAGHSASLGTCAEGGEEQEARSVLRSPDAGGAKRNGPRWTRTSHLCLIRAAL